MKPSLVAIEDVLEQRVRPLLYLHGGDVEVNAVDDAGRVHLSFVGACDGCFLRPMTLAATIAPAISRINGVAGTVVKGMVVSPRTLAFVHERLSKERA